MGISYSSTLFKAFSCSRKVYNFTRPEKKFPILLILMQTDK